VDEQMADICELVNEGYYEKVEELLLANPELVRVRDQIGDQPLHISDVFASTLVCSDYCSRMALMNSPVQAE
jgi:hypothetical protein